MNIFFSKSLKVSYIQCIMQIDYTFNLFIIWLLIKEIHLKMCYFGSDAACKYLVTKSYQINVVEWKF